MSKKTDLVLSTSAALAAISALAQVASISPDASLHISNADSEHRDVIRASLANSAVNLAIRKNMFTILPKIKIDKVSLEDAWIRLASIDENIYGDGSLFGHTTDSTFDSDEAYGCYSNCHSACHGSRGWR